MVRAKWYSYHMSKAEATSIRAGSSRFSIKPIQIALLLALLVGTYFLLPQLSKFGATLDVVRQASWLWLAVAIFASLLTSCLAAVIQFAAGNFTGTVSDLLVLQFAGSFANHFLPYSLAGIELTVEYYHRLGRRRPRALVLATIPTFFGLVAAVILVLIISPLTLLQLSHSIHGGRQAQIIVAIVAVCILLSVLGWVFYRKKLDNLAKQARQVIASMRNPRQLLVVGVGSVVIIMLCAFTLYASVRAVHTDISLVTVVVLYVGSLFVSNVAPTPGGLGAIEAVLVVGLSRAGLSLPQAVTATLIYRFATFWLPLLPGGLAMVQLNRRYKQATKLAV